MTLSVLLVVIYKKIYVDIFCKYIIYVFKYR